MATITVFLLYMIKDILNYIIIYKRLFCFSLKHSKDLCYLVDLLIFR
nr:MAG TPA: hypothetical protein [Myoviridae sp. ctRUJ25]DAR93972.1 MAG TPA: hypothetical protein [Caudoviricetes sp.]DAS94967.1 MAG TPA: hypothetical protein [Caudoviricetes sp.]DAY32567.1 MAG TPA: hypothetical protein [Caudoviricetes sp.]